MRIGTGIAASWRVLAGTRKRRRASALALAGVIAAVQLLLYVRGGVRVVVAGGDFVQPEVVKWKGKTCRQRMAGSKVQVRAACSAGGDGGDLRLTEVARVTADGSVDGRLMARKLVVDDDDVMRPNIRVPVPGSANSAAAIYDLRNVCFGVEPGAAVSRKNPLKWKWPKDKVPNRQVTPLTFMMASHDEAKRFARSRPAEWDELLTNKGQKMFWQFGAWDPNVAGAPSAPEPEAGSACAGRGEFGGAVCQYFMSKSVNYFPGTTAGIYSHLGPPWPAMCSTHFGHDVIGANALAGALWNSDALGIAGGISRLALPCSFDKPDMMLRYQLGSLADMGCRSESGRTAEIMEVLPGEQVARGPSCTGKPVCFDRLIMTNGQEGAMFSSWQAARQYRSSLYNRVNSTLARMVLNKFWGDASTTGYRRLHTTVLIRKPVKTDAGSRERGIANLDEFILHLNSWGVNVKVVVAPSPKTPPAEQAQIFAQTGVLITPTGSQLGNLHFLPAGAAVIEITPYKYHRTWVGASAAYDVHYYQTVATSEDGKRLNPRYSNLGRRMSDRLDLDDDRIAERHATYQTLVDSVVDAPARDVSKVHIDFEDLDVVLGMVYPRQ